MYDSITGVWTKQGKQGVVPPVLNGAILKYYNGSLFVCGGEVSNSTDPSVRFFNGTYKYDLALQKWEDLSNYGNYEHRYFTGSIVLNHSLYLLYGWSNEINADISTVAQLDLENLEAGWTSISVSDPDEDVLVRDSYGIATDGNFIYMFGGYNANTGNTLNSLLQIDVVNRVWTTLSSDMTTPSARMLHSFQVINGKFYLFGGISSDDIFDDLWMYDPDLFVWTSLSSTGTAPSARYGHASAAQGDVMVVWGGQGIDGLLSDMYQYNVINLKWSFVAVDGVTFPSARAGACMGFSLPIILLFGGETISAISNQVWQYNAGTNEYIMLSPDTSAFEGITYPSCELVSEGDHLLLYVMYGSTEGEQSLGAVRIFNTSSLSWSTFYDPGLISTNRALGIVKLLKDSAISISGEAWSTDPYRDVYLISQSNASEPTYIGTIPNYIYGGAFVYYKTTIYNYGGGAVLGSSLRTSVSSEIFYTIDLATLCNSSGVCVASCSIGTYLEGSVCVNCPEGSYSDSVSNSECTLCQEGTYNSNSGANSNGQCYPCPAGSYSNTKGSSMCLDCPNGKTCPTGSITPDEYPITTDISSNQPVPYDTTSAVAISANSALLYTIISIFIVYIFIVLICFRRISEKIKIFDIYKQLHTYKLLSPITLQKTSLGGIFALIFVFAAVFIIASSVINFQLDNEEESKSLVPLVILEKEVGSFKTEMWIDITLLRYGGTCTNVGNTCNSLVSIDLFQISIGLGSYQCSTTDSADCVISYHCIDCEINTGAYLDIVMSEKLSYASALTVNVTCFSSIPNSNSSISETITPPTNTIFRGFDPTYFHFTATPSYFKSQLYGQTAIEKTGYHISSEKSAERGSYYFTSELAFTSDLKVTIFLEKSNSSLYTLRYSRDTVILLINGLLGSVFGVMSAVGGIMRFIEGNAININDKLKYRRKLADITICRKDYELQCDEFGQKFVKLKTSHPKKEKNNGKAAEQTA